MKTPILGGYAVARSVNAADNRLMNLYPEATPEGGKSSGFLTRCPGYKYVADVGTGPIRGLWTHSGFLYVVSGVELYKVDSSWSATLIGTVSGSGPVSMSDNGDQLFIACNPRSYTYSVISNTFAEITDPDFPGAVTVGFINGYFVFNEPDSQKVWITSYQDGSAVDPLEFAFTDANPDNLLSLVVNRNEIWMFGTTSTEVWYYSGDIDFPLARIQGAFNEIGCAAPYSVAKLDNTVFWLGSDPRGNAMVYKAVGYGAQRVSTHGIEKVLQGYQYVGDAIGYSYQQEGHTFYVLTFPSANATWVFDAATNEWHERGSWKQGRYNRHRSNCQANFNNMIVLGDFQLGKLYEFDLDYYKDDIGTQRWVRSWRALPPNANNLNRTAHHSLQVEMETGTTGAPAYQADPTVVVTLDPAKSNSNGVLSGGDIAYTWDDTVVTFGTSYATAPKNTGKYYFEVTNTVPSGIGGLGYPNWSFSAGISADRDISNNILVGTDQLAYGYSNSSPTNPGVNGTKVTSNIFTELTGIGLIPQGGYLGVAVDFDQGKIWFNVNGTWAGGSSPETGTGESFTFPINTTMYPALGQGGFSPYGQSTANFGTAAFNAKPTGFLPWNRDSGFNFRLGPTTFNPGDTHPFITLSNGNLTAQNNDPSYGSHYGGMATHYHNTGKRYFEFIQTTHGGPNRAIVGLVTDVSYIAQPAYSYLGAAQFAWGLVFNDSGTGSYLYNYGVPTFIGSPLTSDGDVVGVAIDFDAGKMWFSKNGVWVNVGLGAGDPETGQNPSYTFSQNLKLFPAFSFTDDSAVTSANFGLTPFAYTAPTGFSAWSANATIVPPSFAYYYTNPNLTLSSNISGDRRVSTSNGYDPLGNYGAISNIVGSLGKRYFEFTIEQFPTITVGPLTEVNYIFFGLVTQYASSGLPAVPAIGYDAFGWSLGYNQGRNGLGVLQKSIGLIHDAPSNPPVIVSTSDVINQYDTIGVAVDFDAGKMWFSYNNIWAGGSPEFGDNPAFTFTPNTPLYAAVSMTILNTAVSVNLTGPFRYSIPGPSGAYSAWGQQGIAPNPPAPSTFSTIPKVLLRWSDDGGHTWSNYYDREMGALGEYWTRVIWRRLGMTTKLRDRVYELSGSDPVKITITGAELLLSGTNS